MNLADAWRKCPIVLRIFWAGGTFGLLVGSTYALAIAAGGVSAEDPLGLVLRALFFLSWAVTVVCLIAFIIRSTLGKYRGL